MSQVRSKTIYVYKKDDLSHDIAVFMPTDVCETSNKKELMINPTIEIQQNSTSSLKFEMSMSSQKWKDICDVENIYETDGRRYTALNSSAFKYQGDIVSVKLLETWYLLSRQFVQAYNVPKDREGIDEHTVVLLPKSDDTLVINGVSYNDNEVPYPRGSAGYNLWAILKDTDWSLGICDVIVDGFSPEDDYGVFNIETDMKTVLENIELVQSLYGGILVWDSINNILNLRDEDKWNNYNGLEIRSGKNLKSPVEVTQDNDIYTVIYPLGDGNLNIKSVNDGKNYVENFSYTTDRYTKIINNSDIYDQKQLKFWGESQLKKYCKPRKSIDCSMIDVSGNPDQYFETFDMHDIVNVFYDDPDTGETVSEQKRIISLSYNVFEPYNATTTIGDKLANVVEMIKQSFDMSVVVQDKVSNLGFINANNVLVGDGGITNGSYLSGYLNKTKESIDFVLQKTTDNSNSLIAFKAEVTENYATTTLVNTYAKQSETYTQNAVAGLKLYVDGDFSTSVLQSAYDYTDVETGKVSRSVSKLELYVDGDFSRSILNSSYNYTDKETDKVSDSLAEYKTYASKNFATTTMLARTDSAIAGVVSRVDDEEARVDIIARNVDGITAGSYITVSSSAVYLGYSSKSQLRLGSSGWAYLVSDDTTTITSNGTTNIAGGRVKIDGKFVSWEYIDVGGFSGYVLTS